MKTMTKGGFGVQFQQIEQIQQEAREKFQEYQRSLKEAQVALRKLAEVASETCDHVGEGVDFATMAPAKRRKGRPAKAKATVVKNGRRKSRKIGAKTKTRVRAAAANGENKISLKRYTFDLLGRPAASIKKVISGYPESGKGLKVSEIKEIIENEGKWSTDSEIGPQIHNALFALRNAKKVERNEEDRRYHLVEGAEYDA